jgi:uncharacterized protein YbaP (TraB family)
MKRLDQVLCCLCILISGAAHAEPALWLIKGAHGKVYLFGTVHALRHDTVWRSPKISAAFAESQDLWLELTDDDQTQLQPLIMQYGTDPTHPLSSKLPAADLPKLEAAAKAMGAPSEALLEPMQPWLAGLSLTVAPLLAAGFDPESGVEKTLKTEAAAAGKPVRGLETAEAQIRFLADMSAKLQVEFLESVLDDFSDGPAKLDDLIKSWQSGDVDALSRLENDELLAKEPEIYATLIAKRNAAWADALAARLQQPGVSFIAVGAAHLAGPDSVQNLLAKRGITAVRQ